MIVTVDAILIKINGSVLVTSQKVVANVKQFRFFIKVDSGWGGPNRILGTK